jgi:hypothetical protein
LASYNLIPAIGSVVLDVSMLLGIPDSIPPEPQPHNSADTVSDTIQDVVLRVISFSKGLAVS